MNNLSERCSFCRHAVCGGDMFYLDCDAPEDYRCKHEVCPYFESDELEEQ